MKKNNLLIAFLFVFGCNVFSQSSKTIENDMNNLKKWAVVKLTIAHMEGEIENNNLDRSEKSTYDSLRKYSIFDKNEQIDLEDIANILDEGWSKTKNNIFNKYKNDILVDNIEFNNIEFYKGSEKRYKTHVENAQRSILEVEKKLNNSLQKNTRKNHVAKNNNHDGSYKAREKSESSSFWSILWFILFAISCYVNYFLFDKYRKMDRKLSFKSREIKTKDGEILELTKTINKKKDYSKTTHYQPQKKFQTPEPIQKKVEETIKTIEDKLSEPQVLTITHKSNTKQVYLPSPFEENKFAAEEGSENVKSDSLYFADIDANDRGEFKLIATANLAKALNSPDSYLATVCEYGNAYNQNAKQIEVVKPGKLKLDGEDWIVTEKVVIKFI